MHSRIDPGAGYFMNAVSWIAGVLITAGVITTGISADKGGSIFTVNSFCAPTKFCAKVIIGLRVTEPIALFLAEIMCATGMFDTRYHHHLAFFLSVSELDTRFPLSCSRFICTICRYLFIPSLTTHSRDDCDQTAISYDNLPRSSQFRREA